MNYLQPDRLDALARAHALGTLSPRAARRFARTLATSAVAAQAVARWQEVLGTLELAAPPVVAPREIVWEQLRERLFEPSRASGPSKSATGSRPPSSRGAAAGSLAPGLAALAGLALGLLLLGGFLQWRPHALGLEPAGAAAPASYVGVLLDAQGHAAISTIARRHGRVLTVRALAPLPVAAGRQLVIWAWNDADPTPHAIARWPRGANAAQTVELPLPAEAEVLLGKMTSLGASLENAGAVPPAPAAGFVARGACAKVW